MSLVENRDSGAMALPMSQGKRPFIYRRDGGRCRYCGVEVYEAPTLDHAIPKAQGGPGTRDNLVLACQTCNSKKANRTPEEAGMTLMPVPAEGVVVLVRSRSRFSRQLAREQRNAIAQANGAATREALISAGVLKPVQ